MLKLFFKCVEREELPQDAVRLPDIVDHVTDFRNPQKAEKYFTCLVTSSLHSWTTLRSLMT